MGVIRFPKLAEAEVSLCSHCEGSWYPQSCLASLMLGAERGDIEETELAPTLVADRHEVIDLDKPVHCPECHQEMTRFSYDLAPEVELDECTEHGIWLDDGELGIMLDQILFRSESLSDKRARLESERVGEGMKPVAKGAISPFGLTLRVLNSLRKSERQS
jgi:Zn-finger nucleic acid-binding protein